MAKPQSQPKPKRRKSANTPGPKPDMLKLQGDWQDAMKKSLSEKETSARLA